MTRLMSTITHAFDLPNSLRQSSPELNYEELYDLEADPHEQENLVNDEACQQVRAKLTSTLAMWMHETDNPVLDGPVRPDEYDRLFDGLE